MFVFVLSLVNAVITKKKRFMLILPKTPLCLGHFQTLVRHYCIYVAAVYYGRV